VRRVFKDKEFSKRAKKANISDQTLIASVAEADRGIIAASLGSELIKLRIARAGAGKSGGFRTILAYRKGHRAFFIHFFAKNASENIDSSELRDLKEYGEVLLGMTESQIEASLKCGVLYELEGDKNEKI
jgi:hypothetical protein